MASSACSPVATCGVFNNAAVTCPVINTTDILQFPFDIYAGTSTGFLKACKLDKQKSYNINVVPAAKAKDLEITCMDWWDNDESYLLTARRDGSVFTYDPSSGSTLKVPIKFPAGSSSMISVRSDKKLTVAAFDNGKITCSDIDLQSDSFSMVDEEKVSGVTEICAGQHLSCMDYSDSRLIAAGGKESPLKIWDVTSPKKPIFTAKNVKNDWLNLRVPIWVTQAQFMPDNKNVVTSTGYSEIRLYDHSASQRRPVLEVQLTDKNKKYPITALALRPDVDSQIVVGTTVGTLALVDLRKSSVVKFFKTGSGGGITDVKCHPKLPMFASCGMDSYLHCFNLQDSRKTCSLFLHAPINCLLFSAQACQSDKPSETVQQSKKGSQKRHMESAEDSDDDMWKDMEVVQTKKQKSKSSLCGTKSKTKRKITID